MTNLVFERGEDLLIAVGVGTVELAPHVTAEIFVSVIRIRKSLPGNDACPGVVDVDIAGVVEHIGGEAAGGTHVHFQGEELPRLMQAEELEVEETLADVECFERALS